MQGTDAGESERYVQHHHAPPHLFRSGATHFITARTLDRVPVMEPERRRQQFIDSLFLAAAQRGWKRIAWVALPDHYHCILQAPEVGEPDLSNLIRACHRFTARNWNREDRTAGRVVWYQYWDTCLTHQGSFYARLNYIHYNPVKHGLVTRPEEYPFSSYRIWQELEDVDLCAIEADYPWDRLDLEFDLAGAVGADISPRAGRG